MQDNIILLLFSGRLFKVSCGLHNVFCPSSYNCELLARYTVLAAVLSYAPVRPLQRPVYYPAPHPMTLHMV